MKRPTVQMLLAIVLLATTSLQAEVIPGRWEKVEALEPGTAIIVKLKAGDRLEGAYKSATTDGISLSDARGAELKVPKSEVRWIETTRKVRDRLYNGTLIGMGVGSGAGILAFAGYAASVTASGPIWGGEATSYYLAAGLVGAGIGALVGASIDATTRRNEVLYKAP